MVSEGFYSLGPEMGSIVLDDSGLTKFLPFEGTFKDPPSQEYNDRILGFLQKWFIK